MMPPKKSFPSSRWDSMTAAASPSWYLDPLVAAQKRRVHLDLFHRWMGAAPGRLLKTDLFEEAYGEDQLLGDLAPACPVRIGMDLSPSTVLAARLRPGNCSVLPVAADARCLPFRSGSLDLIVSNSTLDHFSSPEEFHTAIAELTRVLQPGGRLMITMDNLANPTYWLLRWSSKLFGGPFPMGYTTTGAGLSRALRNAGLEVTATATLIHNPRVISTLLFLAARRVFGVRADGLVRAMLRLFGVLEQLPTRRMTACFVAVCAVKPGP